MINKKIKTKFKTIFDIVLSTSIIVAGACLIGGCISIFLSNQGYSRQIVTDMFAKIRYPIYVCLTLLIISFILTIFLDADNKKIKFYKPKNFKQNAASKTSAKTLFVIKITIIILGLSLLIFGAINGGFVDVLTKAVNICTECIGLG